MNYRWRLEPLKYQYLELLQKPFQSNNLCGEIFSDSFVKFHIHNTNKFSYTIHCCDCIQAKTYFSAGEISTVQLMKVWRGFEKCVRQQLREKSLLERKL